MDEINTVTSAAQDQSGVETAPAETHGEGKTFLLRHLDTERTVTEEEIVPLAQKGLDYDRVRQKYDEAKPLLQKLRGAAKAAGMSEEEYLAPREAEDKKERELREFRALFPEAAADPAAIDPEVWEAVRGGRSLAVAFACHALAAARAENEKLAAKLAQMEKGLDNARRSTGSLASAGEESARRDAFTAGWNG